VADSDYRFKLIGIGISWYSKLLSRAHIDQIDVVMSSHTQLHCRIFPSPPSSYVWAALGEFTAMMCEYTGMGCEFTGIGYDV